jgi:phosphate transport system substrate-binding protein
MKKSLINTVLLIAVLSVTGCSKCNRDPYSDTPTTGRIKIGVDETFKPVAEAELMVFQGLYRYSEIKPIYLPEKECIQMLFNDSVHLVIAARTLNSDEKKIMNDKKILPRELHIATDAVALIVNPANSDTIMSLPTLEKIMTGKINNWEEINQGSTSGKITVVFDNKYSSIVRYVADSIAKGQPMTGNLYALDSNLDVVGYVSRNPGALGLIGVSWISDNDDTTQLSFLKKVRVVALSREEPTTYDNSWQPYQAYIYDGTYPLTRSVYAINTEPRNGLATGFDAFLASDKGQRIILKTGILPATAPVRVVKVREGL